MSFVFAMNSENGKINYFPFICAYEDFLYSQWMQQNWINKHLHKRERLNQTTLTYLQTLSASAELSDDVTNFLSSVLTEKKIGP